MLTLSQLETCAIPFEHGKPVAFYEKSYNRVLREYTFVASNFPAKQYTIKDSVLTWVHGNTLFAVPKNFKDAEKILIAAGYCEGDKLFVPDVDVNYMLMYYQNRFADERLDRKWRTMCDYVFQNSITYKMC